MRGRIRSTIVIATLSLIALPISYTKHDLAEGSGGPPPPHAVVRQLADEGSGGPPPHSAIRHLA